MNSPLVSVIIPTYNRAKTIKRCINSVLNQTYNNIEIIIIDDGSIDSTKAIVDDYIALWGGDNKMIRYIYQKNAGAQVARKMVLDIQMQNGLHFWIVMMSGYQIN